MKGRERELGNGERDEEENQFIDAAKDESERKEREEERGKETTMKGEMGTKLST